MSDGSSTTSLPVWLDVSRLGVFVGRKGERALLDAAWDQALRGRRQVLLVGGMPGIGKSRLVAEVATAAYSDGAIVAHGVCHPEQSRPFQPFAQIFEHLGGRAWNSVLSATVDYVQHALNPRDSRVSPGTETALRNELFEAIVGAMTTLADIRPLVLVIDDIHNATQPTLDLVSRVVRSIDGARLMLLMTFRSTLPERTPSLARLLAGVQRLPGVSRIDLGGLDETEIRDFLITRPRRYGARHVTADLLRKWTAGNPYYLSELCSVPDAGFEGSPLRPPPSVGDAIRVRMMNLSSSAQEAVKLASAAALSFDAELLADCLGKPADAVRELLDEGVSHGFLIYADDTYDFTHELTRQSLRDDMSPSEIKRLHGSFADALIARHGDDQAVSGRIAYHLTRAQDRESDAIAFATRAGEFSERALAFEEAAEHYAGAARLADDPAASESLLHRAGRNLLLASRFGAAISTYRELCVSSDDERRALAAIGLAEASWRPGRLGHEAIAQLRHALNAESLSRHTRTRATAQLARAYGYSGLPDMARQIGNAAVAAARNLDDRSLLALALISPGYANPVLSRSDLDSFTEGCKLAREVGDLDLLAQATFVRATHAYALGERAIWQEAVAELETITERSGQPFHRATLVSALGSISLMRGQYAEALGVIDRLLELEDAFTGLDRIDGIHGSATFVVRRELGLEDIRPLVTGDLETEVGDWKPGLLALYTEFEMRRPAAVLLDELMASPISQESSNKFDGTLAVYLAEAACFLEHRAHAESLYRLLSPRSGTNLVSGFFVSVFGSADRYLGLLADASGRDAGGHFEAAVAMDTEMGATHHRAESLARYAQHLRARSPERALTYAQEAFDMARLMGSVRIQRIAMPPTRPSKTQLTVRELEVLDLITQGCSNKEISERLFISNNTAANHVRHILTKTGAKNRTEAARMAMKRGLIEG